MQPGRSAREGVGVAGAVRAFPVGFAGVAGADRPRQTLIDRVVARTRRGFHP